MLLKYLMLILSSLFFGGRGSGENQGSANIEIIKQTIRSEVYDIGYKFLIGVVTASVMIYSIVQLGEVFQIWMSRYEHGFVIELVTFGLIFITGVSSLYFIFNKNVKKVPTELASRPVNVNLIVSQFLGGFLKEVSAPKSSRDNYNSSDYA